jgi:hypothetical protein
MNQSEVKTKEQIADKWAEAYDNPRNDELNSYDAIHGALTEYAQQVTAALSERPGMKWVKASERLPEMEKYLHLKDNVGIERMGNFYKDGADVFCSIDRTAAHESFIIPGKHFNHLFWLDESAPKPKEGEKELFAVNVVAFVMRSLGDPGILSANNYLQMYKSSLETKNKNHE